MIYSKTSEYGIRALGYLASKPAGSFATTKDVSGKAGVPQAYVAKIFQCLTRAKILHSHRGPTGGYYLLVDPSKLTLSKVIGILDDEARSPFSGCVMGLNQCMDDNPCPLHPVWKRAKERMEEDLLNKTIMDVVKLVTKFKPSTQAERQSRSRLSKGMKSVFTNGVSKK